MLKILDLPPITMENKPEKEKLIKKLEVLVQLSDEQFEAVNHGLKIITDEIYTTLLKEVEGKKMKSVDKKIVKEARKHAEGGWSDPMRVVEGQNLKTLGYNHALQDISSLIKSKLND